jgi:pyridoxine 4-dehydrogenase
MNASPFFFALSGNISFARILTNLTTSGNAWNGGEFYGNPDYNSLVLVERYLEKYPEDADKIVLSIKGGMNPATHKSDGSPGKF